MLTLEYFRKLSLSHMLWNFTMLYLGKSFLTNCAGFWKDLSSGKFPGTTGWFSPFIFCVLFLKLILSKCWLSQIHQVFSCIFYLFVLFFFSCFYSHVYLSTFLWNVFIFVIALIFKSSFLPSGCLIFSSILFLFKGCNRSSLFEGIIGFF